MELLDRPEYGFLKNDPHLGQNIIFLTYGGSYAYGTNVEGSDIDIRGCTLNRKADLLDMGNFEQVVDDRTDTTGVRLQQAAGPTHQLQPQHHRVARMQAGALFCAHPHRAAAY